MSLLYEDYVAGASMEHNCHSEMRHLLKGIPCLYHLASRCSFGAAPGENDAHRNRGHVWMSATNTYCIVLACNKKTLEASIVEALQTQHIQTLM
jgi:hypothetical protein